MWSDTPVGMVYIINTFINVPSFTVSKLVHSVNTTLLVNIPLLVNNTSLATCFGFIVKPSSGYALQKYKLMLRWRNERIITIQGKKHNDMPHTNIMLAWPSPVQSSDMYLYDPVVI
jgi:hypothetical protein